MNLLDGYGEGIRVEIPRIVFEEILLADEWLGAYFGAGHIGFHEFDELLGELKGHWLLGRLPYLAVCAHTWGDDAIPGPTVRAAVPVGVYAFLRPATRASSGVVPPDSPEAADGGSGVLTGDFAWAAARTTPDGPSYVQEVGGDPAFSDVLTLTDGAADLTLPTVDADDGLLLFRTLPGGARFLLRKRWAPGDVPGTFLDGEDADALVLGEESAPIRGETRRLLDKLARLLRQERLELGGRVKAYGLPAFSGVFDRLREDVNVRVVGGRAIYEVRYSAKSGESALDAAA